MRHVIAICRALISIYRSSLMIGLALGCTGKPCADSRQKLPNSGKHPLLGSQAVLKKDNTPQQRNQLKGKDEHKLDDVPNLTSLDNLEPPIKKVKKRKKRVAKVEAGKQVIVFLHGLHRVSHDFHAMQAALKRKFPYAIVVALESVAKDLNKKGSFSPSPTMNLSIKEQAKLAYEEIQTKVLTGGHVVLVGHSQGGLRAFTLVKEYGDRLKSENGIVIDKLITIGTPWKGAPVMRHIKDAGAFKQKFKKIKITLNAIRAGYSKDVRGYFLKFMPELASIWPGLYAKLVPYVMEKRYPGAADLMPDSDFIRHYVASGLENFDVPITAIAGVCTDFSKLFEPFPSSIQPQELAELNAVYAALIGDDPNCAHDMLLPVRTQHAEGLVKQNFQCIKVEGACHGNKVGVSVKPGLSELNNEQVIEQVVESIDEAFYEVQAETFVEEEGEVPSAA